MHCGHFRVQPVGERKRFVVRIISKWAYCLFSFDQATSSDQFARNNKYLQNNCKLFSKIEPISRAFNWDSPILFFHRKIIFFKFFRFNTSKIGILKITVNYFETYANIMNLVLELSFSFPGIYIPINIFSGFIKNGFTDEFARIIFKISVKYFWTLYQYREV